MNNPTVAIFDDHQLYRQGLKIYISGLGCKVLIESASINSFLEAIESCPQPPDICFIDLDMINTDGYELAKTILRKWPGIIVIILSMSMNDDMEKKCYEAGVHSYIEKINPSYKIKDIINKFKNQLVGFSHFMKKVNRNQFVLSFKAA